MSYWTHWIYGIVIRPGSSWLSLPYVVLANIEYSSIVKVVVLSVVGWWQIFIIIIHIMMGIKKPGIHCLYLWSISAAVFVQPQDVDLWLHYPFIFFFSFARYFIAVSLLQVLWHSVHNSWQNLIWRCLQCTFKLYTWFCFLSVCICCGHWIVNRGFLYNLCAPVLKWECYLLYKPCGFIRTLYTLQHSNLKYCISHFSLLLFCFNALFVSVYHAIILGGESEKPCLWKGKLLVPTSKSVFLLAWKHACAVV
jgi:hypothetical protein